MSNHWQPRDPQQPGVATMLDEIRWVMLIVCGIAGIAFVIYLILIVLLCRAETKDRPKRSN